MIQWESLIYSTSFPVFCVCACIQVPVCVYVSRSSWSTCSHVVVLYHAPVCCHTLSDLLLANRFTLPSLLIPIPHYLPYPSGYSVTFLLFRISWVFDLWFPLAIGYLPLPNFWPHSLPCFTMFNSAFQSWFCGVPCHWTMTRLIIQSSSAVCDFPSLWIPPVPRYRTHLWAGSNCKKYHWRLSTTTNLI